ncbi:hypothetical protein [Fibrobacter sp. UWP2]|uniref:hypothetical protein n=1 Tax=Fibrobacter sp. UWP2 TaxID=1896216 RepID=UPI00091FDDB4|nr:hypothetical protein [Fibrobacter sp. UWP2]SHI97620.1 hypothetical protein SAMN05720471_11259 [Fibrobacter sp. UWP2]
MKIGKQTTRVYGIADPALQRMPIERMYLEQYVVQLFANINATGHNHNRPISCGTASIIPLGGRIFLLTAAHVADEMNLAVPCPGSTKIVQPIYMSLEGTRLLSIAPSIIRNKDDKDWALIPAADEIIIGFQNIGLRLSNYNALPTAKIYTVVGFPSSRCKAVRYKGKAYIKSRSYSYSSPEADLATYKKYGLDPKLHIAIPFNRGYGFYDLSNPKRKNVFPDIHAMSGSPIYNERGFLVGIFTACSKDKEVLLGTRFSAIVEDISSDSKMNVDFWPAKNQVASSDNSELKIRP